MRKRLFTLLLTLAVMLTLMAIPVSGASTADSGKCGENLTWSLLTDGTLNISGDGPMYDYEDGSPWAESEPAVTSVIIQPGCTSIGIAAFAGCVALEQISIPSTVTAIRGTAFLYCMSLGSVVIPNGVTEIEAYTFRNCSSLTSVSIPNSVTKIGESAFTDCDALASITIPGSVTEIEESAFYSCGGLSELQLGEGVSEIGDWAFVDCSSLTALRFPSSLTRIGDYAFFYCTGLLNVTFNSGLVRIGEWAFSGCGLTSVEIPDSVNEIGLAAFQECRQLTDAVLPDGLAAIEAQTFCDCSRLTTVTIPKSVTTIGSSAFDGCSRLADVYYPGPRSQWNQIAIGSANAPLSKARIHTGAEITGQPEDYVGKLDSTAKFTVTVTGEGLTYQWQYSDNHGASWSNSSVKTASYTTKLTPGRDGRMLRCVVKDSFGNTVISDAASMELFRLTITTHPENFVGPVNSSVTFRVAANGENLTYQWQISDNGGSSWSNSSVKTASYTTKLTTGRDGRLVRCIVSDADGNTATSEAASMKIDRQLEITGQPEDCVGGVNSTVTFRVTAEGEGLTYQWQISDDQGASWSNSSVKSAAYTTKLTAGRDGRLVRCIVKDADGNTVISDAASMRLYKLTITGQPQDYVGKVNSTAKFSVTAEGEGLTYQWQYSTDGAKWANSSVKAAAYSTKLTAEKDGRLVRCVVKDQHGGTVTSDPAAMRIG